MLAKAGTLVPPLDMAITAQAGYDAGRVMAAFFVKNSTVTGQELAGLLSGVIKR